MRTTSTLAMSATALLALSRSCEVAAFRANASGVIGRSLSHLVGGGSGKTCDAPSKPAAGGLDTSRTGVKRGLFSKLFGGASEGIDYSTLKGALRVEACCCFDVPSHIGGQRPA